MTSVEKLPRIDEPVVALRLMYEESLLTDDALGDSMSALQLRCIETLNTKSDMDLLNDEEIQRVGKVILRRSRSELLEADGFFELLSATVASPSCERDEDNPLEKKRKRSRQRLREATRRR